MLDDDQRERELSRMLAGVEDSDTARAHARELLEAARPRLRPEAPTRPASARTRPPAADTMARS